MGGGVVTESRRTGARMDEAFSRNRCAPNHAVTKTDSISHIAGEKRLREFVTLCMLRPVSTSGFSHGLLFLLALGQISERLVSQGDSRHCLADMAGSGIRAGSPRDHLPISVCELCQLKARGRRSPGISSASLWLVNAYVRHRSA